MPTKRATHVVLVQVLMARRIVDRAHQDIKAALNRGMRRLKAGLLIISDYLKVREVLPAAFIAAN